MKWTEVAERMEAAIAAMEAVTARWEQSRMAFAATAEEEVGRIIATVESDREAELQRRLDEAEAKIAQLEAASAEAEGTRSSGRKTVPAMVTKQDGTVSGLEAASLDVALASLSIEQRFAVKAELLRKGVIG